MKKIIHSFSLLLFLFGLICLGSNAHAQGLHLTSFQVGATGATQGGGFSMGVMGRYLPEFDFRNSPEQESYFSVGLDLGLSGFNDANSPMFLALECGVFGAYHFNPHWDARVLVGAQTWTAGNGTAFFVGPEVVYHFASEFKPIGIDGVFVSDEPVFQSKSANLVSAGVQFVL
jgi:hypothetical protein